MSGKLLSTCIFTAALFLCAYTVSSAAVAQVALEDLEMTALPGERFEIELIFNAAPPEYQDFMIQNPPSLSMDFPNVSNQLTTRRFPIQGNVAENIMVLEGQGRTRMVVNLNNLVTYETRTENNSLFVLLQGVAAQAQGQAQAQAQTQVPAQTQGQAQAQGQNQAGAAGPQAAPAPGSDITSVGFQRGENGSGEIRVGLANASLTGDVRREGNTLILELENADISPEQQERLIVTDFATPVQTIDVYEENGSVMVAADIEGGFDYLAYQTGRQFIINVSAAAAATSTRVAERPEYSGERISLTFQDIPVRSVLQTLAEFQDFSLVVSDAVSGNITMRLDDVPWDQALDLVLRSRGLGQRLEGTVLYVAPLADITSAEIQQLENEQAAGSLAPLQTAYIPINYAVASEVLALIGASGGGSTGLLSERGSASVDSRTNTLIVRDAATIIEDVRELLARLDVPVRQVQIQARIVNAETSFSEALGVRWGGFRDYPQFGDQFRLSGSLDGLALDAEPAQALFVDLGVAGNSSSLALGYAGDNALLQLELSALEDSGKGEVVAQPSIVTQDQQVARIESGLQIPYQAQAGGTAGGSTTEFVNAVLSLEVTPQITPDGRIIMLLDIHQDAVVPSGGGGPPAISTNNISTRVLVDNGDTIVLGGVFREEEITTVSKTMLLGDLPYIGNLFKRTESSETKTELLIFITPSIVGEL